MIRSRVMPLLTAVTLAAGLSLVAAAPSSAADPTLSAGCARLHSFEPDSVVAAAGVIHLDPQDFVAGEEVRLVATSVDGSGVSAFVTIYRDGQESGHLLGAFGKVILWQVSKSGSYSFDLSAQFAPANLSWQLGCGLPPKPTFLAPAGTIYVGDHVQAMVSCAPGTNALSTCQDTQGVLDPACAATGCPRTLDTSIPGSYAWQVTGTDSRGLVDQGQFGYQVLQRPQSLTFTSQAPDGVIYDRDDLGYVPTATATSGLPVTYEVPNTGVCYATAGAIGSNEPHAITVHFVKPGICSVVATQPGNTEWALAPGIVQNFRVSKETSTLSAARASKGVLGLTPSTFKATLNRPARFGPGWADAPYAGQTVTFTVAGQAMCSAVTDSKGVATCNATIGLSAASTEHSYQARYAGDSYTEGSSATGVLWSLLG